MGLLDDAIREHLDLKRRSGADPTEVDQLEREALGPVRRGAQVSDQPLLEEEQFEHESGHAVIYDDQAPEGFEDAPALPPEPDFIDSPDEEAQPSFRDEEPEHAFREEEQEGSWSHLSEDWDEEERLERDRSPAAEEPFDPAGAAPARDEHHAVTSNDETVEYSVEAEHEQSESPEKGAREDVLEETPEFLQDTPDHDRLWFEQRPPKDFNFDD